MRDAAIIGECTDCGGRMIETAAFTTDSERRATLYCGDCQTRVRIEHKLSSGGLDAVDADGVRNLAMEAVAWVDCERCHGRGEILGCIDYIGHAKGRCIHNGNDPCPRCDGTGAQPRVTATDGGLRETHIGESGLFVPQDLREFQGQIVFRTPRSTIQHFGSTDLDAYYGMIQAGDFGKPDQFRDPKNPNLAPDRLTIKPQGEEPVEFVVETDPDVRCDGGSTWKHLGNRWAHSEEYRCTECGRETSISNRSDQYQEHGEPEPCDCIDSEGGER